MKKRSEIRPRPTNLLWPKCPYRRVSSRVSRWFECDMNHRMAVLLISWQTAAVFPQVGYNYAIIQTNPSILLIVFSSSDMITTQNRSLTGGLIGLPFEEIGLLQELLLMKLQFSHLRHEESGVGWRKLALNERRVFAGNSPFWRSSRSAIPKSLQNFTAVIN